MALFTSFQDLINGTIFSQKEKLFFKSLTYVITNIEYIDTESIRWGYGQLTQGIGTDKYICKVHLWHLGQRLNVVSCL